MSEAADADRRRKVRGRLGLARFDALSERPQWFKEVYDRAEGDLDRVPWADLKPKPALVEWLAENPGERRPALDVACGLGDNAEAIAAAGYEVTAFDFSETTVAWARRRFPESPVSYVVADLLDPPDDWTGRFDLVHECHTLQALWGDARATAFARVAGFVAPGGLLLIQAAIRPDIRKENGPPWPLTRAELARFEALGFVPVGEAMSKYERRGRPVEELRASFRRS